MKSFEEKAMDFVEYVVFGDTEKDITTELVKLLKEQDRDTRHACSDAVAALWPVEFKIDLVPGEKIETLLVNGCIGRGAAYRACINTNVEST